MPNYCCLLIISLGAKLSVSNSGSASAQWKRTAYNEKYDLFGNFCVLLFNLFGSDKLEKLSIPSELQTT